MIAPEKSPPADAILVGTYRKSLLEKWILPRGLYNYPVEEKDQGIRSAATEVGEIWLYAGKSGKRRFAAAFDREVSAEELDALGYPRRTGKPHSDRYLLFAVKPLASTAERPAGRSGTGHPKILVRRRDFVRSPKALQALRGQTGTTIPFPPPKSIGRDGLVGLPSDLLEDWRDCLCVCEGALQLEFWMGPPQEEADAFPGVCRSIGCIPNVPGWPDRFGEKIKTMHSAWGNRPVKTLSLFSGAGGLDIGFSDAGFDIVESVEVERKFCDTLELNSGAGKRFSGAKVNCIDIRKYTAGHLGKIDFIIGGPPCQTFSAAGRRANGVLGTTDARGVLFREYVRLLGELSPAGFLFENVYGITGAQNGTAWREIQAAFREAGYTLFHRILDAADYGVPQHRERLIIVGLKTGEFRFPRPTHGPDSADSLPFYNAGTAVRGVPLTAEEAKPGLGGRFGHLLPGIPPGLNYSFYTEKLGHPNPVFAWRSKFSDFLYKADPAAPVRTIKASGGAYTGPLHWENRFFALGEYKRLQTFPDDYEISGGNQIAVKQIGNSVPPQLARMLALAIQVQVFGAQYPFTLPLLGEGESLSFRKRKADLTREYQKKAAKAISKVSRPHGHKLAETDYFCELSPSFEFRKTSRERGEFTVSFRRGTGLVVRENPNSSTRFRANILIRILPRESGWILAEESIDIRIHSGREKAFTVGWKAFEQLLVDNGAQADLVQLNGYYQYEPQLRCSCEFRGNFPFKDVVSAVVAGRDVARILPTERLAADWAIPAPAVWEAAEFLRSLGYEVRNPNTNPQIPPGHWLIPYAFPTFTQRSVQLRKKLR
jgi:DNA (cytosine-5)-methyltransferase 1